MSISVLSGALSVDAAPQKAGDVTEVRAGSSALAIRGTYFVAEFTDNGLAKYTMFEGEGVVDGVSVPSGYILVVTYNETTQEKTYDVVKLELNEDTSEFVLQCILDDPERFIDEGII